MGSVRRFRLFALFAVLLLGGGCDGIFGGSSQGAASSQDGGPTCDKNWQELSDMLAQPQACTTSATCPTGSHCANEVCDWECYADSDCGAGNSCSCDGVCTVGTDPGTDPVADPACPRNLDLLADPATDERACLVDDQCPYGARCDRATGTCASDCLPGDCEAGLECDCRGTCSSPGASDPVSSFAHVLSLSRSAVNLADGDGSAVRLTLRAGTEELAMEPVQPVIELRTSPKLQVTVLDGSGAVMEQSVSRASVDYWSFQPVGAAWEATVEIRIETLDVISAQDHEYVRVSGRVAHGAQSVSVVDRTAPTAGEWRGVVSLDSEQGAPPVDITVGAIGSAAGLVVIDDTRQLSATGRVELPAVGQATTIAWLGAPEAPELKANVRHVEQSLADGVLRGSFSVSLASAAWRTYTYDYELRWSRDFATAACSGNCEEGAFCASFGRCIPGQSARTTAAAQPLESASFAAWRDAATWLPGVWNLEHSSFVEKLMCVSASQSDSVVMDRNSGRVVFPHDGTPSGPVTDSSSGELRCDDGEVPKALGFALQADLANEGDAAATTAGDALLDECLRGLAATPKPLVGSNLANLRAWYDEDNACVDIARVYPSLEWLARGSIAGPERQSSSSRSVRMLQRLLSQWSVLHSFIGRQAREQYALDRVLESGDITPFSEDRLTSVLNRTEEAWQLLTSERFSKPLLSAAPGLLRDPDYRDLPAPVAYWTFDVDDMAGNMAIDQAGLAHIWVGSHSRSGDNIYPTGSATIPNVPLVTGDFTVSWWGYTAMNINGFHRVLSFGSGADEVLSLGFYGSNSTTRLAASHRGIRSNSSETVSAGLHAFSIVRNTTARTWEFYVDGQLLGYPWPWNGVLANGTHGMSGEIEFSPTFPNDISVWDVALSSEQIQELSDRGTGSHGALQPLVEFPDSRDGDQELGLAASLLEGSTEYLYTASAWARARDGRIYLECRAGRDELAAETRSRLGLAARTAVASRVLAERYYDRASIAQLCTLDAQCAAVGGTCELLENGPGAACTVAGQPVAAIVPWEDRWRAAELGFAAALSELAVTTDAVSSCENPLGIPAGALPLNFGDVAGENSRFFAASDYLMEHLAAPAVTRAVDDLAGIRENWQRWRSGEIQDVINDYDRDRRLDQIESQAADELVVLCGYDGVDPMEVVDGFAAGETPDNCYIQPSSYCRQGGGGNDPDCYRGELGRHALAIDAARADAAIAKQSFEDANARFHAQGEICHREAEFDGELADSILSHQNVVNRLVGVEVALNSASSLLGSLNPLNPLGFFGGAAASAAHAVRGDLTLERERFSAQMQIAEVERRGRACLDEYRMLSIGLVTHAMQVERSLMDVEAAALAFRNQRARVLQVIARVEAALAREHARELPSMAHHYWLEEKLATYRAHFAWARRVSYLAVLAAEYELQQSLPVHRDVLLAANPHELKLALSRVNAERAARSINGRRPAETSVVLSLRDDILRLGDRSVAADGERAWSPRRRFGEILRSPEYAVYDEYGAYVGQGIPFSLEPFGALDLRCAERLWRVGATIQGDITDADAPGAYMVVRKRNTFASQWCTSHGDGSTYQFGAVRPAAQLFSDAAASPDHRAVPYSSALLYPWFNVPRSQFYQSGYVEGSSEELAGRGVYGEYVLLFPEYGMLDFTSPDPADRFDLSKIEDVLIRFDLLSVDDIQGF